MDREGALWGVIPRYQLTYLKSNWYRVKEYLDGHHPLSLFLLLTSKSRAALEIGNEVHWPSANPYMDLLLISIRCEFVPLVRDLSRLSTWQLSHVRTEISMILSLHRVWSVGRSHITATVIPFFQQQPFTLPLLIEERVGEDRVAEKWSRHHLFFQRHPVFT